jgi:shikimate dehydrogenase
MRITGTTRIAGVMGWPIAHSRSPRLHGYWLERYGVDGAYVPFPVAPERLDAAVRGLPALGLCGCNVTVPHKEGVARLMDRLEPAAARIGAVNCIVVGEDGGLEGRNTDVFGFMENLKLGAPAWSPRAAPAVVVGAGGAARAVVYGLIEAGVPEVRLINRTQSRGEALAEAIGGPVVVADWVSRETSLYGAGLVVNTTVLGMHGQPPLDLDLSALPDEAVVTDIVYTPLETPLLAAARARGMVAVDGLGMLLHQARPSFAAWFGIDPEVDDALRRRVLGD